MYEDISDLDPENYIGSPFNCNFIRVSIKNFISDKKEDLFLSQIKFFFGRKQKFLLAIQFLFQNKENFGNQNPASFISFEDNDNNKYLGVLPKYSPFEKKFIEQVEEFILNLSMGEEICSFSGEYSELSFHKINIKTNFGKFFIIGDRKLNDNFNFKFLYNKLFFDGLVIGILEDKITYLKPIVYEDRKKFQQANLSRENKHKKELLDISEDLIFPKKVEPIYKTNVNGIYNLKTIIIDDMEKTGLLSEIKDKKAALTEIKIFSNGKRITRIDNQYIHYENENRTYLIQHISQEYNTTNMNYIIKIDKDDYINKVVMFISKSKKLIKDVEIITKKGISLRTFKSRPKYFRELKGSFGKELRILGMCVGAEKYIQFLQLYYELKNME